MTTRFPSDKAPKDDTLKAVLHAGLSRFHARTGNGVVPHAPQLFSYCALERERLAAIRLPHPVIGIVLRGEKEVWRGEVSARFTPGTAFVLPGDVALDIWNIPDEGAGLYQSLVMEVTETPRALRHALADGEAPGPRAGSGYELTLDPHLVETLIHAATSIAEGPAAQTVRAARIAEVLALLRHDPAARPLFRASLADAVAHLIAAAPAEPWSVKTVAARLGMAGSTLRRRLAREDTSFRRILRTERLNAARQLIAGEDETCLSAALAAGYASRSHFARRYREAFGHNPSGRRTKSVTGQSRAG